MTASACARFHLAVVAALALKHGEIGCLPSHLKYQTGPPGVDLTPTDRCLLLVAPQF
jgi:hypothetical protein